MRDLEQVKMRDCAQKREEIKNPPFQTFQAGHSLDKSGNRSKEVDSRAGSPWTWADESESPGRTNVDRLTSVCILSEMSAFRCSADRPDATSLHDAF